MNYETPSNPEFPVPVRRLPTLLLSMAIAAATLPVFGEPVDWTQWGGPGRDFEVADGGLADAWPEGGPKQIWSRELGGGYAAILAENGRLYTGFDRDGEEIVTALDAATGETLWEHGDASSPYEGQAKQFGTGPNATPILVGDSVCLVGFTGILRCLHKDTGKLLWSTDLVKDHGAKVHDFGYSNAPIVHEGRVLVLTGGDKQGALGFDPGTGEVVWRAPVFDTSYSSPILIEVDGDEQLVFMAPTEVVAVGMSDAQVRWSHPHKNRFSNNCTGPWWDPEEQLLFVSSQADGGSRTLALSSKDGVTTVMETARDEKLKIFHNNALRRGNVLYASSGQFLVAHDLAKGADLWREREYPEANLVAAGDKVLSLDENGELSLLSLSPEKPTVHARHKFLDKPAWTAPTLVGTRLYLRDTQKILALELGPKAKSEG